MTGELVWMVYIDYSCCSMDALKRRSNLLQQQALLIFLRSALYFGRCHYKNFVILLICFSYFAADTRDGKGCAHHQLMGCKKNNKEKQNKKQEKSSRHSMGFSSGKTPLVSCSLRIVSSDTLFPDGFSVPYLLVWKMS